MKKTLAFLLTAVLMCSFVGCNSTSPSENANPESSATAASSSSVQETSSEVSSEAAAETDRRNLETFKQAFIDAGFSIERESEPIFSMIGASDGTMFYINDQVVKIYQYESEDDLKSSQEEYSDIVSDFLANGCFLLETSSEDAIKVFNSVDISADPVEEVVEPEPVSETLSLGETGTLGDWEVTVSKIEFLDSIQNGDFISFNPDEGNKFAVVSLTISNQGKESDTFLPSIGMGDDVSAKILYGDGYEFSSTYLLGYELELHDASLNPLSSKDGIIAFEVPQQVVDDTESPLSIQFDGPGAVTFNLR